VRWVVSLLESVGSCCFMAISAGFLVAYRTLRVSYITCQVYPAWSHCGCVMLTSTIVDISEPTSVSRCQTRVASRVRVG